MSAADRATWTTRKLAHGDEAAGRSGVLHLSPEARLECLWELVVMSAELYNAGRALRPGTTTPAMSTDESEFRRDVVRIVRRGG